MTTKPSKPKKKPDPKAKGKGAPAKGPKAKATPAGSAAAAPPPPEAKTYGKILAMEVDDKDLAARHDRLVQVCKRIEKVTSEKASAVQEFNASLKDLRAESRALVAAIETHTEEREVQCWDRMDYKRGCVEVIRSDTGKVIDSRAMTLAERQAELSLPGTGDPEEGDGEEAPSNVAHFPVGVPNRKSSKAPGGPPEEDLN